jgi:hypothetical protein
MGPLAAQYRRDIIIPLQKNKRPSRSNSPVKIGVSNCVLKYGDVALYYAQNVHR